MGEPAVELRDSRRLTGPSLVADGPGAVIDGAVEGLDSADLASAWRARAREALDSVGWSAEHTAARCYRGGVTLFVSAPIDSLYAATEVNEWAWAAALHDVGSRAELETLDSAAARLRRTIEDERNPALLALQAAAVERGVTFLWDDDHASLGTGRGVRTWSVTELPRPEEVAWEEIHDIPRVLVTGTNGKTTTVRMVAAIARAAGRRAGFTSTDGIYVGGELMDAGDWSGPGGARALLREPTVEIGVLETARGGMLRRGLGVNRAEGALVTNVAADHLGEWGVLTVDDVARAKLVIAKSVGHGAPLVVNADDPYLSRAAQELGRPLTWIAADEARRVRDRVGPGELGWTHEGGVLQRLEGDDPGRPIPVADVEEIPSTLGGAALHNVCNALGAAALAHALGLTDEAIRSGLMTFSTSPEQSPGRGNLFDLGGVQVMVDFVHNPHGFDAMARMVAELCHERVGLMIGQAGDRDDESIRAFVRAAWGLAPDRVAIKRMAAYTRGRALDEVPAIIRAELTALGAGDEVVTTHDDEVEATRALLQWSRPGDFIMLSSQAQRTEVLNLVDALLTSKWRPGERLG